MATKELVRARLLAVIVLALVFGGGFTLGMAADRWIMTSESSGGSRESREGEERGRERRFVIDQIDLSSEQRASIDSIVEHHRELMEELNRGSRAEYRRIVGSTRDEIKRVLTPEQATQYDSLLSAGHRRDRSDSTGNQER